MNGLESFPGLSAQRQVRVVAAKEWVQFGSTGKIQLSSIAEGAERAVPTTGRFKLAHDRQEFDDVIGFATVRRPY